MWGLSLEPALDRTDLLAAPVAEAIRAWKGDDAFQVAQIDPDLADTAAFCERYGVPLDASANCVIVAAKRGGDVRLAACVVLATTRADVNGVVRRRLDARKASFAPQEQAVAEAGMEYGGITPFGLPADWPVLVDQAVVETPHVVVGSGVRRSKLIVPGTALASLGQAEVIEGLAH
ncbi:YbaK/EbsC family protein [Actinoallomurus purpureus]|uniref:YbaK/EbsC family protein n=1 Tax=Actinoallomurus purpureus TaxID=478114 RepID=UPI0020929790|nr:YbaK/EbsC family protein [Actinoallomurus purpureus]MCO6007531.1 YbaK/EbsC family protein [Actinoallomurus purpureus]